MIKKIIFIVALAILNLSICFNLVNAVWIDEIYYNPINSENGGEALVLYNDFDYEVDLSGWRIETHKLNEIVSFEDVVIKPKGYLLVADQGWDENRDNWNSADYESTLSLGNVDYGIALFDNKGVVVDRVGWGNVNNIENGFYLGSPALKVEEGMSLLRFYSKGNNLEDFQESIPLLRSSLSTENVNSSQKVITFNIDLSSEVMELVNYSFSADDFSNQGVQIVPLPGINRSVDFNFTLVLENEEEVFLNRNLINSSYVLNDSIYFYESSFFVEYNKSPGNYSLSLNYGDNYDLINYEIMPLVAIEIDSLDFDVDFDLGKDEWIVEGDEDMSTLSMPTIRNVGNVDVNIMLKQSSLDLGNVVPSSNIMYSFDNNDFSSDNSGVLSNEFSLIDLGLRPSFVNELGFKFSLSDLEEGSYVNHIVLMGVEND